MVDDTKKVEDKDDNDEESESELDLSIKAKSNKINILGQKFDWPTLISLGLGALGTLGAGYLIYNEYNKNKVNEDARKYEQWILQQQSTMNQPQPQVQVPQQRIPPPDATVDMNSVSSNINYDKFLDRGLPSGGSKMVWNPDKPIPTGQLNASNDESVVDMEQYDDAKIDCVPVITPVQRKKQQEAVDPTTEELMNAMNQYEYGS